MTRSKLDPWSVSARWVFPVDRPPLEGGVVVIQNERIVAVEKRGSRKPDQDFGDSAILPGLVNAHAHLDLRCPRGPMPWVGSFVDWLRAVIRHRRGLSTEQVLADIRRGVEECLRFGTTLVGDISSQGLSWPILVQAPLRAVVYHELLGLPKAQAKLAWSQAKTWVRTHPATATCRAGLSPHAPYSVRRSLIRCVASLAARARVPLTIHLGETEEEMDLLVLHTGPFVDFLRDLGVWDEEGLINLIELCDLHRGLDPVAFAHGNYVGWLRIAPGNSFVFCPRTHAFFEHGPHPAFYQMAQGVNVALGTDSLASNPDLDILAELRFLSDRHPKVDGATLLRMATLNGAKALGWEDETGSLTPGKSADLLVVPCEWNSGEDPHRAVFQSAQNASDRGLLFRGQWIRGGDSPSHVCSSTS
jgi:cytosine/adenosine deaminase-related metal-dependent hydrolase